MRIGFLTTTTQRSTTVSGRYLGRRWMGICAFCGRDINGKADTFTQGPGFLNLVGHEKCCNEAREREKLKEAA